MVSAVETLHQQRKRLLAEANRARNSGRERVAIALYKRILLEEPRNVDVALRAAPLLAWRGEAFEAWQLFRMASREYMRERRREECLATLREACRYVPGEYEAWRLRADLEVRLGRDETAYETLLQGRQGFKDSRTRAQAIALLERARAIEPHDTEVALDLARLYTRTDQVHAALELLGHLARRVSGRELRRVCALQFRTTLSPRSAWAWLRALWSRGKPHAPTCEEVEPLGPERVEPSQPNGLPEPTLPLVGTLAFDDTVADGVGRITH